MPMPRPRGALAPIIALVAASACSWDRGPAPPKGDVTAKLALPLLSGGTFDSARLAGKKVLVTFWSPDCGVCVGELPRLQALADRRPDITFLTVAVKDKPVKAQKILRMTGLRAPVLVDRGSRLIKSFGGDRVPYTLVLDGAGHATALFIGKQDTRRFEAALDGAGS